MNLLQRADIIINGDRQADYGHPRDNMTRIAEIWSVVLGQHISPSQVCACMVGVKLARLANVPDHEDTWLDIAGYAGVWDRMKEDPT